MIQKQGNWVPYELKPRDVERRFFACEELLQRQNWKGFLNRIVTGDEKWVHYDNPKCRKSWAMPGNASMSMARPNIHGAKFMICIWWDHLGVVYYELLKPSETITVDRYRTQLRCLSQALKEKRPQYQERHAKVIIQHDNARSHVARLVKTYVLRNAEMGAHTPAAVLSRHCFFWLPFVSIDGTRPGSSAFSLI